MENNIIIGSGAAGMAASLALRGALVIDAGLRLDSSLAVRAASLGQVAHRDWTDQDIHWLQESMTPSSRGVESKLYFGSDFPYRMNTTGVTWDIHSGYRPSLAFGGLSSVWGASVLPFWHKEVMEWPIPSTSWDAHYRAVLRETGLAGVHDSLSEIFPLYHSEPEVLAESNQAKKIRERMDRSREELTRSGFRWGRSRLMVRAREKSDLVNRLSYQSGNPPSHAQSCVQCGMCMYGCPYDLIYSSRKSILRLAKEGKIRYQSGFAVEGFREWPDRVEVWGKCIETGHNWKNNARRLYLAAGTLSSTALVLGSPSVPTKSAQFLDSQYFSVPLFLIGPTLKVRNESLHTLAQLFLEILPGRISSRLIHLQIYTYNDMIYRLLAQKFGPLLRPIESIMGNIEGRLVFLQGYLHSDDSGAMKMSLDFRTDGSQRVSVDAQANPRSRQVIRSVLMKLFRHIGQTGFIPIWPMLQIGLPGRGFHSGGSFPMSLASEDGKNTSDLLGRPLGLKRVHLVDSSTFPSIPATTITLAAMANAHRIATLAGQLKP